MANILITGISGFVGKHTARELIKKGQHKITALIRPNTDKERIKEFIGDVNFIEIDLCDVSTLSKWIQDKEFDLVLHIGALRGGRPDHKDKYYLANVEASNIIANYCLNNNSRLIFCSSVGVFGAIPKSLPADDSTPRKEDNYYHFTKIKAEESIEELRLKGLNAVIVRPAITYGKGDYGFPYTLCKLIDKGMMILPSSQVMIHLTNVQVLAQAFSLLVNENKHDGSNFIVADKKPVNLLQLSNYISRKLKKQDLPKTRIVPTFLFRIGESVSRMLKNELFVSRFELISRSWYYQVENTYESLDIEQVDSLDKFDSVINWYKEVR